MQKITISCARGIDYRKILWYIACVIDYCARPYGWQGNPCPAGVSCIAHVVKFVIADCITAPIGPWYNRLFLFYGTCSHLCENDLDHSNLRMVTAAWKWIGYSRFFIAQMPRGFEDIMKGGIPMKNKRRRSHHHIRAKRPDRKWIRETPRWNGEQIKRAFNARAIKRKKAC